MDRSDAPEPPDFAWLGASNFARCLPEVARWLAVERPHSRWLSACGHGRSYCGSSILGSRWLGRELPSIGGVVGPATESVEGSASGSARRVSDVILGDFGNDLAYGRSADEVLVEVEHLLQRARRGWRRVVLVEPPLASVSALSPTAFRLASGLLFPGRGLDRARVLAELETLHSGLHGLANRTDATWVDVPSRWLGVDGIHVRRRFRRAFVERVTAPLATDARTSSSTRRPGDWPPWWRRRPEYEAIWCLGWRRPIHRRPRALDGGGPRFV